MSHNKFPLLDTLIIFIFLFKLLDKCVTAKEEMEKDLFEKVCDEYNGYWLLFTLSFAWLQVLFCTDHIFLQTVNTMKNGKC